MREEELNAIYDEMADTYANEPFFIDCSNGNEWGFNFFRLTEDDFAVRTNNPTADGEWEVITESDIHNFAMKCHAEWEEYKAEIA